MPTRPDVEVEAGRGNTDSAARPVAGEGAGGDAPECPACQIEVETLVLEPPRPGVEGATEVESAPWALVVEETRVPKPKRAGDEGIAAEVMVKMAPMSTAPVVVQLLSSDEYGDSRDLDPTAATSAADRIAEFMSASEEVLGVGTSEGPSHGAIIQSGVPLEFHHNEQEEEAAWRAQYKVGSQIQGNLDRALQLHRTTDLQISKVGALPLGIARVRSCSCVLYSHFSTCSD